MIRSQAIDHASTDRNRAEECSPPECCCVVSIIITASRVSGSLGAHWRSSETSIIVSSARGGKRGFERENFERKCDAEPRSRLVAGEGIGKARVLPCLPAVSGTPPGGGGGAGLEIQYPPVRPK